MHTTYKEWLEARGYQASTVNAQIHRASKVEKAYGDLDEHYASDRLATVVKDLRYSMSDERQGRPNESKMSFQGNIRNNLASYRNAVERYRAFLDESSNPVIEPSSVDPDDRDSPSERQRFGLERDMQIALREEIQQLEPGLEIIDEGVERSVTSGFVDITARDKSGAIVVIELKTGTARQKTIGQILSYMGDVADEEEVDVRGVLIAAEFDHKTRAAARMIPKLELKKYQVRFEFSDDV